jgi:glutamate-1-semialdehyde 2,1-aminomutase
VACPISEPILQNIGVVKPQPGYLQGVRDLCNKYDVVYIMDEVETSFRHALGGKGEIMNLFNNPDLSKRVLIAGTYNGHPVPIAAAIGTIKKLPREPETYTQLESFGARIEDEINDLFCETGREAVVSRQSSAWCVYFMDHALTSWHESGGASRHEFRFAVPACAY